MNRDSASQLLTRARTLLASGDLVEAEAKAIKAQRLFPSTAGEALLAEIAAKSSRATHSTPASAAGGTATARPVRTTTPAASPAASPAATPAAAPVARDFTPEQAALAKRIVRTTDLYVMFEVEKSADDEAIKRSYRKLAIKLHPDKNGAPGAEEAFKAVAKAYGVLSDERKRRIYDQTGTIEGDRPGPGGGGGMPGFAGGEDFAETLFREFFGGHPVGRTFRQFNNQRPVRRDPNGPRFQTPQPRQHEDGNMKSTLFFLAMLGISLLVQFAQPSSEDFPFAFEASARFTVERNVVDPPIVYFVSEKYQAELHSESFAKQNLKMRNLEATVVKTYIAAVDEATVARRCRRETFTQMKKTEMAYAKGNNKAAQAASEEPKPRCMELKLLAKFRSRG